MQESDDSDESGNEERGNGIDWDVEGRWQKRYESGVLLVMWGRPEGDAPRPFVPAFRLWGGWEDGRARLLHISQPGVYKDTWIVRSGLGYCLDRLSSCEYCSTDDRKAEHSQISRRLSKADYVRWGDDNFPASERIRVVGE